MDIFILFLGRIQETLCKFSCGEFLFCKPFCNIPDREVYVHREKIAFTRRNPSRTAGNMLTSFCKSVRLPGRATSSLDTFSRAMECVMGSTPDTLASLSTLKYSRISERSCW